MATVSCSPAGPGLPGDPAVTALIDRVNTEYLGLHRAYEDNFWSTKMGLAGSSSTALASSKSALDNWLASPQALEEVRAAQGSAQLSAEQRRVLGVMHRTFETYTSAEPEVATLRDRLNRLEAALAERRRGMCLGFTDPRTGRFRAASAVQLRNSMKMSPGETDRKAAYDALCSIGPFVAGAEVWVLSDEDVVVADVFFCFFWGVGWEGEERRGSAELPGVTEHLDTLQIPSFWGGTTSSSDTCTATPLAAAGDFCEIVKVRNQLAAAAGFANYYDMKVQAAEGFDLGRLFEMLDGLETATRPLMTAARQRLADAKGPDALQVTGLSASGRSWLCVCEWGGDAGK